MWRIENALLPSPPSQRPADAASVRVRVRAGTERRRDGVSVGGRTLTLNCFFGISHIWALFHLNSKLLGGRISGMGGGADAFIYTFPCLLWKLLC